MMRFHEPSPINQIEGQHDVPEGTSGNVARLRGTAEALLAAGTDAINRALSQDSQQFLKSVQQAGGQ